MARRDHKSLKHQKLTDFLGPDWGSESEVPHDEVHGVTKTAEEMEAYTLPEDMDDLERVEKFLTSTLSLQQWCGVKTCHLVVADRGAGSATKALPKLLTLIAQTADEDMQCAGAEAICSMIEQHLLTQNEMKSLILPSLKLVKEAADDDVRECFIDVLSIAIDYLPPQLLEDVCPSLYLSSDTRQSVLGPVLALGEVQCSIASRVACCKLLGKLATRMSPKKIAEKFFFKAMSMCQDTAHEVRAVMCEQLNTIARGVGQELTHQSLLEELNEVLSDEEWTVRSAALIALVDLMDFVDDEARSTRMLPQLRGLCKDTPDAVVHALTDKIGEIFWKQRDTLGDDRDSEVLYNFFKKTASNPDVELRMRTAFNLPGIIQAMGVRRYAAHGDQVVRKLAEDSDAEVRQQLAKGFHEICDLLKGDRSLRLLKDPFLQLLGDADMAVREIILAKTGPIMDHFDHLEGEDRTSTFRDILQALAAVEQVIRGNWRREVKLLEQLGRINELFSEHQVFETIVPVLSHQMADASVPVRVCATPIMCQFIRHSRNMQHRFELTQKLVRDFGRGRSFSHRMLFYDICVHVNKNFSRHFFRQYFYEPALDLMADPVPNVRRRLCALLPVLKNILRLPEDQGQLDRVQNCMSKLVKDMDPDVAAAASQVSAEVMGPLEVSLDDEQEDKRKRADEETVQRLEAEATKRRMVDEATERAKGMSGAAAAGARRDGRATGLTGGASSKAPGRGDLKKPGDKTVGVGRAGSSASSIVSKISGSGARTAGTAGRGSALASPGKTVKDSSARVGAGLKAGDAKVGAAKPAVKAVGASATRAVGAAAGRGKSGRT